MTLKLDLRIEKRDVLCLEEPQCDLTVANGGTEPVRLTHPVFRIVDVRSGTEAMHRAEEAQVDLPAGRAFRQRLRLPTLDPGEYAISAICGAESAPATVTVRAATPKNLTLDTVQGSVCLGAWINMAAPSPEIVRCRFDVMIGGGVRNLVAVAKADPRSRLVLSLPPNGAYRPDPWIAWMEANRFRAAFVDRTLEIAAPDAEIVAPLCADSEGRATALILQGSNLSTLILTPERISPGVKTALPGSRPVWMTTHTDSHGARRALILQIDGKRIVLSALPWSDQSLGPPKRLADWEGGLVAAGSTLGLDDVVRGAVLVQREALKLVSWETDAAFRETGRREIPGIPERTVVRISGKGATAVLLRSEQGVWSCEGRPLPGEAAGTKLPLDVAFQGGFRPVLICGRKETGFRMMRLDGSSLPPES